MLIIGATASGKSRVALELAEAFNGAVVNADSMQVYRELDIITNRPPGEELARVPHRLYGFRPISEPYSAALWLSDLRVVLRESSQAGALPIIVGGTGLYFKAATEGLSYIPPVPAPVRERLRSKAASLPPQILHAELEARDPVTAAALRPTDPQRIVRALEVLEATGVPLSRWRASREVPLLAPEFTLKLALSTERSELYRRCDLRFDAMLARGAIEEARTIAALDLDPALPAMRAVGLPPLLSYIRGELTLDAAVAFAKTSTRNYAKRQLTWIKNNFHLWNSVQTQEMKRIKEELDLFLRNRLTAVKRDASEEGHKKPI